MTPHASSPSSHLLSCRRQLALPQEPPSQQGDKDPLQDSEEERGACNLVALQQPCSQLEDEAPCDIQVILPSLGYCVITIMCSSLNFSICLAEFIHSECKIPLGIVLVRVGGQQFYYSLRLSIYSLWE